MEAIKQARKEGSVLGWTLVVYYKMLNEIVALAYMADLLIYGLFTGLRSVTHGGNLNFDSFMTLITERMMTNFWGYLLTIAIGMLILFLWKGKDFWTDHIWAKSRPMTAANFFCALVFLIAAQVPVQVVTPIQEFLLNQIGLSATAALENATITGSSVSMFLYICFVGPFAEEILFRGLLLRSLEKYGKQVAIFVSALFFGLFHGNVVQIPYAFLVGLLLAYVTVEHSIGWAVLLHVFNNFVLADLMTRLSEQLPAMAGEIMFSLLIWGAAIAAVIIAICRRKEIAAYFKTHPFDNTAMAGIFTSGGMWAFIVMTLATTTVLLFA